MRYKKEIIEENEYLRRKVEFYEKHINVLFSEYLDPVKFINELDYLLAYKHVMDKSFNEMTAFMRIEKQQHLANLELEKAERLIQHKHKARKEGGYEFLGTSDVDQE
jgi:hypothetical protein